jgi:Flp pilus assembly protein TadG
MIVRYIEQARRRGTTVVECAIVYPLTMLLLVATLVLGIAVFRYQQLATLAREGARYASVHGAMYASETGNSYATSATVLTNAVNPLAVGLNTNNLSCTVTWSPSSPPTTTTPGTVSVQLSYTWTPEGFFTSPFTIHSTSTMPVSY